MMALHAKLAAIGSKVKSVCAEPGVSATNLVANLSAGHQATKKEGTEKKSGKSQESPPTNALPAFNFKPQSAADGACPLLMAAFAEGAESGDFYMPGDYVENTAKG